MRRGQKSQSCVRHERSIGRYHSPYQHGGTIFSPRNPWAVTSYQPYGVDPMIPPVSYTHLTLPTKRIV